jgi:hypothetical protein
MIKKIIFVICLFSILGSCLFADETLKEKIIFSSDISFTFAGYIIKNNEVYLSFEEFNKMPVIYKYKREALELVNNLSVEETKQYLAEAMPFYNVIKTSPKIVIDKTMYVTLEETGYELYRIYVYKNENKKDILGNEYVCTPMPMGEYIYVDKENKKIYFAGRNNQKNELGLYTYDIEEDKCYPLKIDVKEHKNDDIYILTSYTNPMRIPNTSFLIYIAPKSRNEITAQIINSTSIGTEVYIQEIPEWKAEIEAKAKSKGK